MASSLEAGLRLCKIDCIIRTFCVGHERGRGHNAGLIALNDRAVYARGEAKIICVDDETTHWVSLTKTLHHKGHEGIQRKWKYRNGRKNCSGCSKKVRLEDAIGLGIWQFTNRRKTTSLCSFVSFVLKAKLSLLPAGGALFHPGKS